jgi:hypothetical protein
MDPHRKDGSIRSSRGITSRLKRSIQYGVSTPANRNLQEILDDPVVSESTALEGFVYTRNLFGASSGSTLQGIISNPSTLEQVLLDGYALDNPSGAAEAAAAAAALAAETAAAAAALAAQVAADAAAFACPTLETQLASASVTQLDDIYQLLIINPPLIQWTIDEITTVSVLTDKFWIPTYELNYPEPKPQLYIGDPDAADRDFSISQFIS